MLAVPVGKVVQVVLAIALHSKRYTRRGMAAPAVVAARAEAAVAFAVPASFNQSLAPSLPTPPAKGATEGREAGAARPLAFKEELEAKEEVAVMAAAAVVVEER
jgi:hypothetical protein